MVEVTVKAIVYCLRIVGGNALRLSLFTLATSTNLQSGAIFLTCTEEFPADHRKKENYVQTFFK